MTARCPSDLALEGYLLERDGSPLTPHVGSCPACQARIARMEREGQEFLQYVYPATVAKVEAAAGQRRPWSRWLLLLPIPALGALAALLLVGLPGQKGVTPTGPAEDYVGVKGGNGSIGLTVFLGAAEGSRPLGDGEAVPSGSALRFKVAPTRSCRLWLVSLDAAGQVSRLYPLTGDAGAEIRQGGPLPGGAVLDGHGGPERIFAVCTPKPMAFDVLQRALQQLAVQDERGVRSSLFIPGLPAGTAQTSVLIEKRP